MKKRNNSGLTIMSLLGTMITIAILVIYGSQIAMGFFDQNTIRRIVNSALVEVKGIDTNARSVKLSILRKLSVNDVDVKDDEVDVERKNEGFAVTVDHTKKIKITNHIYLIMDLSVNEKSLSSNN